MEHDEIRDGHRPRGGLRMGLTFSYKDMSELCVHKKLDKDEDIEVFDHEC